MVSARACVVSELHPAHCRHCTQKSDRCTSVDSLAKGICSCRERYRLKIVSRAATCACDCCPRHLSNFAVLLAVLQVTKKLANRGIGTKLQRRTWKEDSYWTITAVKPSIVSRQQASFLHCGTTQKPIHVLQDGEHGVASGVLTWKGTHGQQPFSQSQLVSPEIGLCCTGEIQSEQPKRINGVLKKVWRYMEPSRQLDWQAVPKSAHAAADTT